MIMNKEGYFNRKAKTFVHITKDCVMDCNPKSYIYILELEKIIENQQFLLKSQGDELKEIYADRDRLNKFVDDILNFYKHNRYEEELTEDNMFKLVLNQNEMIMTIEEFKGDDNVH